MKYCKYTLKGTGLVFNSYTELLDYLEDKLNESDLRSITDIVFSKASKQDTLKEKLDEIKVEGIEEAASHSLISGDPVIKDKLSISSFIDSDFASINGHPIVTPFVLQDYINLSIDILTKQGISLEEATLLINGIVNNWDKVAEDSLWIHKLIRSSKYLTDDTADFIASLEDIPERFNNPTVLASLHKLLKERYISEKGFYPNSIAYKGLNLKAKLKGIDKELYDKIDWLFLGQDGKLHLYMFKTTIELPKYWTSVKIGRYLNSLALLKLMLAYNRIDVTDMELNIIPVQLNYNENYDSIQSIGIYPKKDYGTRANSTEYAMEKYDRYARHFISSNYMPFHISSEPIKKALEVCRAIFPDANIRSTGLSRSAKEWIRQAPDSDLLGIELLVITKVNEQDHTYEVTINGTTYNITEKSRNKNNNKEILELVTKHLDKLITNQTYTTLRIKDALSSSFKKGFSTFHQVSGLRGIASKLDAVFNKYVMSYTENPETKERDYEWEMIDRLYDNNIIIFKNKDGEVDFVDLTPYNLLAKANFKGRANILGSYRTDSQFPEIDSQFGNIEIVKTMEFINETIAELGDVTLGNVTVVSTLDGNSRTTHIGQFNKLYFQKILNVIKDENNDLEITNNFKIAHFTDPVQNVLNEYLRIIQGKSKQEELVYALYGFDLLQEARTKLEQENALLNLMQSITSYQYTFKDPEIVKKEMYSNNPTIRNLATLYELITKAYLQLRGETPVIQSEFNKINAEFFTPVTVKDSNLRIIADNMQIAHDTIAELFLKEYDENIETLFNNFFKAIGYTATQNRTIGNLASKFDNFYEYDEQGNNLLIFKNPYDNTNNLKLEERKLLKHVLFQIARINSNGNFKFSSPDSNGLADYIKKHEEYLWVPLERASNATWRATKKGWMAKFNNTWRKIKDFSNSFDEFINGVTDEERLLYGNSDNFYQLNLRNPFSLSIPTTGRDINEAHNYRKKVINKYGAAFFETNIENLLIDFISQHISTTKYNLLLYGTRALILQLSITGDFNGNLDIVDKEIKWIQDYIKVNIFNDPNLTKEEKLIVGVISPVKKIVNHLLLAGNIVGAFRDCLQGVQQNFIRSVIKLGTDISASNLAAAYAYVNTHSTTNPMALNLLSKLNLRFRISNMDQARIKERAKTARTGLMSIENGMYFTLRGPDFLNRMSLFVARCMHDGVWNAFSLDSEGKLKYDPSKDKRFSAYFNSTVGSEEYNKAKSLYLSQIRMYNKEHVDNPITIEDGLPTPYTNTEMNVIRGLADNIYGAYDKSKKSMAEWRSTGFTFLNFFTWMNGIINTYFMSSLKNKTSKLKRQQEVDEQGNKLYFDKDGNITTEITEVPAWTNVPCSVVGIFPMLLEAKNIMSLDGWKAALKYLNSDDIYKANYLKLISDGLMWLFWALLFKLLFDPAYKEYKKSMDKNPVLVNLLTEIIYKSSSRAYDDFKGPLNVLQYFGENLEPPVYSLPIEIFKDSYRILLGDTNFTYFLLDNSGFTRSFRDTGRAYYKSLQQ